MKLTKRIIPAVRIPVVGVFVILAILACQPSEQTEVKKADQQTNLEKADHQSGPKKAFLQLKVNDTDLEFFDPSGHHGNCESTTDENCVHVEHGFTAEIKFSLVRSPKFGFSKMQLVAVPSDVESSAKLNFGNQAGFTPEMIADFYVEVNGENVQPDANGIIILNGAPGLVRNFTLIDNNNFEQIYSYQLEACEGKTCKRSDPKVENEG